MASKKSWKEKITESDNKGGIRKRTDKGMMYISTPSEIAKLIRRVSKGKVTTTKYIAQKLKKKHKVDFTCPLTTGIFVSLVANATEEAVAEGKKEIAPYWRVLKPGGKLYDKYLTHELPQREHLEAEGFEIEEGKGKQPPKVKDFIQYLI